MSKKIKAIVSEKTIVIHYDGKKVNIQKQTDQTLFQEVSLLIDNKDEKALIAKFKSIKEIAEKFSNKMIEVDNDGKATLKGSDRVIPPAVIKKMLELEKDQQDFLPLIRFWRKLQKNPSTNSREQLYGFMLANHIPITEQGDIVVEKGVSQKRGGVPGHLIDGHSGTVDNSVGQTVEMPRSGVVDDPKQTCSRGLHVGAPDFVRNHWNQKIIIECVVNPEDVVSVPVDYRNTKMRVCKYKVMGYSSKSERTNQVVAVSDFVTLPSEAVLKLLKDGVEGGKEQNEPNEKQAVVTSIKVNKSITTTNEYVETLSKMTAGKIITHVEEVTGTKITLNPKNKKAIIKKGAELLEIFHTAKQIAKTQETQDEVIATVKKQETGPWSVRMTSAGSSKLAVAKLYVEQFNCGLRAGKQMIDKAPFVMISGASKRFAERYVKLFTEVGAKMETFKPNVDKKEIVLSNHTIPQLIGMVQAKFNERIKSRAPRTEVESITRKLYESAGYKVI